MTSTYSTRARGRHSLGYLRGPGSIVPGFDGDSPRLCQYIEGEPSGDDSCKCGKPAEPGRPYCAEHVAVCYMPLPVKKQAEAA